MTVRSKQSRRNEALERAKNYIFANSKMWSKLHEDRPSKKEQMECQAKWEAKNAEHIAHLESIRGR